MSAFSVSGTTHDYAGVVVLHEVDFAIRRGEIHALVGQNGCGKSTLVRILSGALQPRAGEMTLEGEAVALASPDDARHRGIGVVHQDYHLFPDLTVADCVYGVNKPPPRRRWTRTVDRREIERQVGEAFDELGLRVRPDRLVRTLGAAERKFVEIARAMLLRPRYLILDEATASFEPRAARAVLDLLERLRDRDIGVCFVTHRLDEVLAVADRTTALRDGRVTGELTRETASEAGLIQLVVGGEAARPKPREAPTDGRTLISVRGARLRPGAAPVDLDIGRGEIIGLVGLVGSGAAAVVRRLGGSEPLRGDVTIEGKPVRIHSPRDASRLGIGFVPEDRKTLGLVPDQTVAVNIALASLKDVCRLPGVVSRGRLTGLAQRYEKAMHIRVPSIDSPVRMLSGGNQQKVMIAKWLASGVRVLAIEEPTHGVDVGGKAQIHNLLREFADGGGTVVLASTDVGEVLELCDRLVIFRHGVVTDTLATADLTGREAGRAEAEQVLERLVGSGTGGDDG